MRCSALAIFFRRCRRLGILSGLSTFGALSTGVLFSCLLYWSDRNGTCQRQPNKSGSISDAEMDPIGSIWSNLGSRMRSILRR